MLAPKTSLQHITQLVLDGSTKIPFPLSRKFLPLQLAYEQLDSVLLIHGYTSACRSEPEKEIQLEFHDIRNPQAQDAKFKQAI